jgi:AcrR family transcriptional regulator
VIDAARELFEENGFHETTVRMIAERAGLSPGGVFTTFEDKVAILCQILNDQRDQLFAEIERVSPELDGPTAERLKKILALAHAHEFPRLRLVLAFVAASYGSGRKLEDEHRRLHGRLALLLGDVVREGVRRGDVRPEVDADLLAEMVSSAYVENYRSAYYAGLGEEELNNRMGRQLDLIFDGARAC